MNDTPIDPIPAFDQTPPPEPPRDRGRDYVFKVLLSAGGRMNDYFWNGINLQVGDHCVVEEDGRPEIGAVALAKRPFLASCAKKTPHGRVLRKATQGDIELSEKLVRKEKTALAFCKEKVIELGLKMNVSSVHYSFDEKKALFFFTAESRIDFRELVRDLNNYTRIKVELRQIGVRDEAKILGGCGPCGGELCCSGFLADFVPVSIRMAKNQFLALSPEKISGVCGRLLCCLSYENDVYVELQKQSPKLGKMVRTPDGRQGKVCQLNLLMDKISVSFEDGARVEYDIAQFGQGGLPGQQMAPGPQSTPPSEQPAPAAARDTAPRPAAPATPSATTEKTAPPRAEQGKPGQRRVHAGGQAPAAPSVKSTAPEAKAEPKPEADSEGWRRRSRGRRGRRTRE
ncbi:MAG: regulatory iron-sulfur-containing complex subunit RicT [Nitrospinota bacterium]|nr:regulatory iron-sulfur-containing complex subunit RicT [Nitrospinota bacterium]